MITHWNLFITLILESTVKSVLFYNRIANCDLIYRKNKHWETSLHRIISEQLSTFMQVKEHVYNEVAVYLNNLVFHLTFDQKVFVLRKSSPD